VAPAQFTETFEESRWRHDVAGVAHDRFEKYARDLRRRRDRIKQIGKVVEDLAAYVAREGRTVGIRIRHVDLARAGGRDAVELLRAVA